MNPELTLSLMAVIISCVAVGLAIRPKRMTVMMVQSQLPIETKLGLLPVPDTLTRYEARQPHAN